MLKACLPAFLLVGFFSFTNCVADAQEVVHAISGVVTSIDSAKKTIDLNTVDGSQDFFKDLANSGTSLDFDKAIREDSTAANEFTKVGAKVIVFYFGEDVDYYEHGKVTRHDGSWRAEQGNRLTPGHREACPAQPEEGAIGDAETADIEEGRAHAGSPGGIGSTRPR